MKLILFAGMMFGVWASVNAADLPIYIYVVHNGERYQMRDLDADTMALCSLKQQVSGKLGLEMRKFNLTQGGGPLDEGKTLTGLYLGRGSVLKVKEVNYSTQCA